MHILEIPSFFPPCGGLFCLDQAKALAALGHEVRILSNVQLGITVNTKAFFTLPTGRYEHLMDGITVYQSYQRGLPRLVNYNVHRWLYIVQRMFIDYVHRYGCPDVLHAHCGKWAGYAAMLISEQESVPYVITEHLPLMSLEEEFGPTPSEAWQIPMLKEAYKHAAMVVPVSEELVEDTACYYGKDYRWQWISNTIDTHYFAYQSRPSRDGRPFRFCCLADYFYRKGYDVLFEAFRQLQQQGLHLELHVAGLFTDGRDCLREIRRLGLKNVKTYGRLNKEGVRDLLYRSDALVLASRSEVQPLVLLEAMSTGIPVIATECVPRCQRLDACSIVPIGDATALAGAMRSLIERPAPDGERISRLVAALASPEVVGRKLSELFSQLKSQRPEQVV